MRLFNNHKKAFILTASFLCIFMIIISIFFRVQPTAMENLLGYIFTPFQKVVTSFSKSIDQKVYFLSNINKIENDNINLIKENEELRAQNERLKSIETQNVTLSKLYELDLKYPQYNKTGAFVISKANNNWFNIFVIDKGTDDGLLNNMVVLTSGGLVGRILEASSTRSKVISIIDDTSAVTVETKRTGDIGFLKGDMKLMFDGLCIMENINIESGIMEGDEIVTSNLSKFFPPGLKVGVVREVKSDLKGLTKYAIVEPVVDFKSIDTVLVIDKVFEVIE